MVERIELATQTLVLEGLEHQPILHEALKSEVNRTIYKSLKCQLVQYVEPLNANQIQNNLGNEKANFVQDNGTVSISQDCYSGNGETSLSRIGLEKFTATWMKRSLVHS